MLERKITSLLKEYAIEFRSVLVIGPRQSGKTTLVKQTFPDKPYVSLENPDERFLAETDSRAFLNRFPNGAILDEVQRVPSILSYLQEILDNTNEDGLFILTGSNNILLQENVSQTLAGRLGILDLLPLSYQELVVNQIDLSLDELIYKGAYPELYQKNRRANLWYNSYIRTYIERDVRQIKNIENTALFIKFLKICAGRIGQILNVSNLSNDCGIDIKTVNSWLSILEQTYIIKLLQPYYKNYNKRILKSPKLYFIDTGLACALINIRRMEELAFSHFRGALVENFIIMDLFKTNLNDNLYDSFYYWRDHNGVEIDLIIDNGKEEHPVEIKSAETFSNDFQRNLKKYNDYAENSKGTILYNGDLEFTSKEGILIKNWKTFLR